MTFATADEAETLKTNGVGEVNAKIFVRVCFAVDLVCTHVNRWIDGWIDGFVDG